jgi:hypothetical protein
MTKRKTPAAAGKKKLTVVAVDLKVQELRTETLAYIEAITLAIAKPLTVSGWAELVRSVKDSAAAVSKMADELAGVTQAVEDLQHTNNVYVDALAHLSGQLDELAAQSRLNTEALLALKPRRTS